MRRLLLAAALALFLAVALLYGRPVAGLWNSPDETANAFWAARVAHGQPLRVLDEAVALGAGAVHPRSMAVDGGALVPGSFPGLILLYGVFAFLFKLPLFLFTPILTAAAALALAALVGKLFDRKAGLAAAALFLVHPAILYYGARGLFHNMLFVDAAIFAAACFALRPLSSFFGMRAKADDALGGFILAWALVVRTSEAVWILPAFAAFLPFAGKERWRRLAAAAAGGLVPLLIFLRLNQTLYGSPWRTAYVAPAPAAAEATLAAPPAERALAPAPKALLPFGFHPRLAARNAWHYGLRLFWWQSLLAAAGFAWWLAGFRKATSAQKMFALAAVLTAAWLAALYGSWFVRDRLDPGSVTIGTSYVRYFLPAYVAALPFAAFALARLSARLRRPEAVPALALLCCAAFGVHAAVFSGDESLRAVRATLEGNAAKKAALLERIEPYAVVMTERFDKLLVPERLRIIPSADAGGFAAAARLADGYAVYWYGLDPGEEEARRIFDLASAHDLDVYEHDPAVPGETLLELVPAWRGEDEVLGSGEDDATYAE